MSKQIKLILLGALILILILGAGYYAWQYQINSLIAEKQSLNIKDKTVCLERGGRWNNIGSNAEEVCNLPTSDAGQECKSNSDCQGKCLAELKDSEIASLSSGEINTTGKCTGWQIIKGCHYFVDKGKTKGLQCID